jgi:outer membrane protein
MNDISLNISAAFFQILLDKELVELPGCRLNVSSLELESGRILISGWGISHRGRVLEIESQLAADQYQLTLARNNLSSSYLDLMQMMQMDPDQ